MSSDRSPSRDPKEGSATTPLMARPAESVTVSPERLYWTLARFDRGIIEQLARGPHPTSTRCNVCNTLKPVENEVPGALELLVWHDQAAFGEAMYWRCMAIYGAAALVMTDAQPWMPGKPCRVLEGAPTNA